MLENIAPFACEGGAVEACEPSDLVRVRASPEVEKGFLCHRDSHCFALRPLHGQWSSSRFKAPPLPCLGRPCHAWGAPAMLGAPQPYEDLAARPKAMCSIFNPKTGGTSTRN